jgi:hypothetical protein
MPEMIETGAAALVFAVVFLAGNRLHPLRWLMRDRRSTVSFGAGMSAAYVFVHLMPELHGARTTFAESVSSPLPFEGMGTYFVALVGFLVYYALEHLRKHLRGTESNAEAGEAGATFRIHVGGFAAYVLLVAYVLARNPEGTAMSIALFVVAMACHFLGVDHSLREEHGAAYDRVGRFVLAGMAIVGWLLGQALVLPPHAIALLVAFISGAIIMNSAVMELPSDKDGRFMPFMIGGILYGLILLPLG